MTNSRVPFYKWLGFTALVLVLIDALGLPYVLGEKFDTQTIYYAIATSALALILASLVELRFTELDKKLNRLLDEPREAEKADQR